MEAKSQGKIESQKPNRRVALYIRVSTREQDLDGYSPEFQYEQMLTHEEGLTNQNKRLEKIRSLMYEEKVPESRALADIAQYEEDRNELFKKKSAIEEELKSLSGYEVACVDLRTFSKKLKKAIKNLTYEESRCS